MLALVRKGLARPDGLRVGAETCPGRFGPRSGNRGILAQLPRAGGHRSQIAAHLTATDLDEAFDINHHWLGRVIMIERCET